MKPIFFKKIFDGPNLNPTGLNQTQNEVFRRLFEFRSKVFLKIAYYDSLRQSLTSSRSKTHEKNFGGLNLGQTGQNQARK